MTNPSVYDSGTYLEQNPTWHEEDSPWKAKQILKILQRNGVEPTSIVEVGCGAGGILASLKAESPDGVAFTGYEISPQAYEICRRKESANLRFVHADILATDPTRADVLMAIDVIEHVEDCFGFLRLLRERGEYKVFHFPLDMSVQMVLRASPIMRCRTRLGHLHYFSKDTALAALRDTGYEVVDWFYTRTMLDLPKRGWKANLLRLPRQISFLFSPDLTVRILGGYSLMILAR